MHGYSSSHRLRKLLKIMRNTEKMLRGEHYPDLVYFLGHHLLNRFDREYYDACHL